MSLDDDYCAIKQAIVSGLYSNPDAELCSCKGSGWILSPFDTWEACPAHPGREHPYDFEWDEPSPEEFDREYRDYIVTSSWNGRYTDWSDQYTWDINIPF